MLEEMDLSSSVAFLFGTELTGLSEEAVKHADGFVKIPMYGFTESFNISVSAALVMQNTMSKLRKSDIKWSLSEEEQLDLKIEWLKKSLKTPDMIVARYFENLKKDK
jgi:tRNA (guanosine-2'-O-)-methyltransferase